MILTPKEEAEKIVNKFIDAIPCNQEVDINKFMRIDGLAGIECALIAVDMIIKCAIWKYNSIEHTHFWQEVKQELEKLKNEIK